MDSLKQDFCFHYYSNKPLYDSIIKIHKEKAVLNSLVFSIEDFFGRSLNGYHVMLCPKMWPGGLSLTCMKNCEDSLQDIYVCLGPKSIASDIPVFGSDDEFKSTVVHEFVHPFIMYYCTKYQEQIQEYAYLYNKDKEVYQNNACPDWFSAINELLTRTVEIIINSDGDNQKAIKAIDYQSKDLGFSCIPILYNAFDKYYSPGMRKESDLDMVFLNVLHSLDE